MTKLFLTPFILANSNRTIPISTPIPTKVGIVTMFAPLNFAVLFRLRNFQKIKGTRVLRVLQ